LTTPPRDPAERERILVSFTELVGERGYERTPLRDVLDRAGVDEVAFQSHFADADECFRAAWDFINESFMPTCIGAFERTEGWREQVRAVGIALIEYVIERPNYGRMLFVEGPTPRAPRRLPLDDPNIGFFIELVDAGRSLMKEPEALTRATAEGLVGAVHQRVAICLLEGDMEELRFLIPQMMSVVVMPYLGPGVAVEELHRGPS
jgi:AcrR family transcriptional regulator